MKHFIIGRIFCKCSARMKFRGKIIRIYENTPNRAVCPNCRKLRKILVKKKVSNVNRRVAKSRIPKVKFLRTKPKTGKLLCY